MEIQENINNLRVASFSSYLNSTEEHFVLKLTRGIQNPMAESEIFSPPESPGRPKIEEGEIDVFAADKYFNMRIDHETTPKKVLIDNSMIQRKDRFDQRHDTKTPSVISSALLPSLLKNPTQNKQKKSVGKRIFAVFFCCNGPCLDKKSVHVSEAHRKGLKKESLRSVNPVVFDGTKQSGSGLRGGENFAFPILDSGEENLTVKKQLDLEEEPRHSIEVFGSHSIRKGNIATNLERKLSVLTWDAIPKVQNIQSNLGSVGPCDDIQSDTSSDLFEIETVCGGTREPMLTIQASDYDEKSTDTMSKMAKTENGVKSRPGRLLGCKTHKSVSVVETAYRTSEKANDSLSPNLPVPLSQNIYRC